MARPLRIEFEDATYHIIARGHRRESIFLEDRDRYKFLEKLAETHKKYGIKIHCYALMPNHYHIVLTTPFANLSKAIHYLNSSYTNWFRTKYTLVGSILQGRYKSLLVDTDSYLLALSAYVHLNPLKAGLVDELKNFKWTSYRVYLGLEPPAPFMDIEKVMGYLSSKKKNKHREYELFVKNQWEKYKEKNERLFEQGTVVGDESFLERTLKKIKTLKKDREIPESKKLSLIDLEKVEKAIVEELKIEREELYAKRKGNVWRKLFIFLLKEFTPLKLREIGKRMGMDYTAVSQSAKRFQKELKKDKGLQEVVERVRRRLREN
ncbi:MAG: transposase [Candidatus Aminicenantes bacterium]|nr:transposase [Candidatus Aminicenantes bacterium]